MLWTQKRRTLRIFSESVTNVQKSNCSSSSLEVREHVWDKSLNTVVCAVYQLVVAGLAGLAMPPVPGGAQAAHPMGSPVSWCPLLPVPRGTCSRPADAWRGELGAKSVYASGALHG